MIFLIVSIPLSLLCAYLAWLAFRVRHRKVAFGLSIVSLIATVFSLGVLGGIRFLMHALAAP